MIIICKVCTKHNEKLHIYSWYQVPTYWMRRYLLNYKKIILPLSDTSLDQLIWKYNWWIPNFLQLSVIKCKSNTTFPKLKQKRMNSFGKFSAKFNSTWSRNSARVFDEYQSNFLFSGCTNVQLQLLNDTTMKLRENCILLNRSDKIQFLRNRCRRVLLFLK